MGPFDLVVVQKRERNVQKSVMHVQSCFLGGGPIVGFRRSPCRRVVES